MTKRTYRYRQWLLFVKEQQLIDSGYYGLIPIIEKVAKNSHLYDPGETFIGIIAYAEAKKNNESVSEFQAECFNYAIGNTVGDPVTITLNKQNHWDNYNGPFKDLVK